MFAVSLLPLVGLAVTALLVIVLVAWCLRGK